MAFDSLSGAFTSSNSIEVLTSSMTWKTTTYVVNNARFLILPASVTSRPTPPGFP